MILSQRSRRPLFFALSLLSGTAGALSMSACDGDKADCDAAALKKLLADTPADVKAGEGEDKERARVSAGIRAACSRSPEWMATRMKREYEGAQVSADERADWLAGDGQDEERKAAAPLRDRVCPGYQKILEGALEHKGRGLDMKRAVDPADLGKHFFEECTLAKHGLYVKWPEPGERGPISMFDYSVFLFLKDSGVDGDTAGALARALGGTMPSRPAEDEDAAEE